MEEAVFFIPLFLMGTIWVILHYMTKWKTAATITGDDEVLLEEMYNLAKRLDERMDTVERLVAHDHADFKPARLVQDSDGDNAQLAELEKLVAEKRGARS